MGQMAATAGGVAIGSVVGHGLTSAIFGSGGSSSGNSSDASQQQQQAPPPQPYYDQSPPPPMAYDAGYSAPPTPYGGSDYSQQQSGGSNSACGAELEQFLQCAQNSADITFCQGLSDALKQCKMSYGQQPQGGEWLSS